MNTSQDERTQAEAFLEACASVLIVLTKNFSGEELLKMVKDID